MEGYQEIIEKLKKELELLERNLPNIKKKKEEADASYQEVYDRWMKLEGELDGKKSLKEELPYSNYRKISIIVGVLALITFFPLLHLCGYLSMLLGSYLQSLLLLSSSKAILISVLLMVVDIPLLGILDVMCFKKIQKMLEKRSYNKIISSDKYHSLKIQIEILERELEDVLDEECIKNVYRKTATAEYDSQTAQILMKKSLINYIENDMNSEVVMSEDKPYTRKKVPNTGK